MEKIEKPIKFKKNLVFKRILFIIMIIITFYIIFNFSAQNGEESGNISKKITEFVVEILSKIKTMNATSKLYYIERLHPIIRKLAHFSIYTVVGFSLMGFMCTFDMRNIYKLITSLGIGVIYAVTDEIHQGFVPGRGPSIKDVLIDSTGVLTGIFILITLIVFVESIVNWLKR